MEEEKVKKNKKKKTPLQIAGTLIDWIVGIFIVLIAAIEITAFATKGSNYGVPSFFGNQVSVVQTDSMAYDENGNKLYSVGTAIFSHKDAYSSLKEGDDVSFYNHVFSASETNQAYALFVHRVIAYVPVEGTDSISFGGKTYSCRISNPYGVPYYIVMGANVSNKEGISTHYSSYQVQYVFEDEDGMKKLSNQTNVNLPDFHAYYSSSEDVSIASYSVNGSGIYMGKVVGHSDFVGGFYSFLEQPYGLILVILLPCAIIVISTIVDMVKVHQMSDEEVEAKYGDGKEEGTSEKNGASVNPDDPLAGLSQEDKKRLQEELLASMLHKDKSDGKKGD